MFGLAPQSSAHQFANTDSLNSISNCNSSLSGYRCEDLAQTGAEALMFNDTSGLTAWTPGDAWGTGIYRTVAIPFPVLFGGNTYNSAYIHGNGSFSFTSTYNYQPGTWEDHVMLPNGGTNPNNGIVLHGTDLENYGGADGVIRYGTRGTAPNRQFIVWLDSSKHFAWGAHCLTNPSNSSGTLFRPSE